MFRFLNRLEKILAIFLIIIFIVVISTIISRFIKSMSYAEASLGGVYSEGIVGKIKYLNPLLSDLNPIDKNLSTLLFSGLMKYNPQTNEIEDDIAIHYLDTSKTIYTFVLRDNVFWHDQVPVNADDIIYTFQEVIQNADFSQNNLLKANFSGIVIKKIDDKTVTFTLQKPYKFFLTNLTIGLLPKHILGDIPVQNLHLSEFNYLSPIGTGPYTLNNITKVNNADKFSLQRNENYYGKKPFIQEINFYAFPNWEQLELSKNILDGVQKLDNSNLANFKNNSQFQVQSFILPKYNAIFFNTGSNILKEQKVRLGLSLGVNKTTLLADIPDIKIIDTPFLELNKSNWVFQYDKNKAQGALNDSGWKLPWKQQPVDISNEVNTTNQENYITMPNNGNNYATNNTEFYLEGKVKDGTKAVLVNDYQLKLFRPDKGTFSYKISTSLNTIKLGLNEYKVEIMDSNNEKQWLDSIKIFYDPDQNKVLAEQNKFDEAQKNQLLDQQKDIAETKAKIEKNLNNEQNYRVNDKGDLLSLSLITSKEPIEYGLLAEKLKTMWQEMGVEIKISTLDIADLQTKVNARDYDILIFGQSLELNLDSYPYWHSSQANNGFNFSQLKNFKIDTLLEEIRSTHEEKTRQDTLQKVEEALISEIPAVFLYSPINYFAISDRVKGVDFGNLKDLPDRFSNIQDWYVNEKHILKADIKISDFFVWLKNEIVNDYQKKNSIK